MPPVTRNSKAKVIKSDSTDNKTESTPEVPQKVSKPRKTKSTTEIVEPTEISATKKGKNQTVSSPKETPVKETNKDTQPKEKKVSVTKTKTTDSKDTPKTTPALVSETQVPASDNTSSADTPVVKGPAFTPPKRTRAERHRAERVKVIAARSKLRLEKKLQKAAEGPTEEDEAKRLAKSAKRAAKKSEKKAAKRALKAANNTAKQAAKKAELGLPASKTKREREESTEVTSLALPADSSDEEEDDDSGIDSEDDEDKFVASGLGEGIKIKPTKTTLDLNAFAKAKADGIYNDKRLKAALKKKNLNKTMVVVYIGRLPQGFEDKEVKTFFSQFGGLVAVKIAKNSKTGASKNYGFLKFNNKEIADIVVETMQNYYLSGRLLQVKIVDKEKTDKIKWKPYTKQDAELRAKAVREKVKEAHAKSNTDEYRKNRIKSEQKLRKELSSLNINYSFEGYTEAFPDLATEVLNPAKKQKILPKEKVTPKPTSVKA